MFGIVLALVSEHLPSTNPLAQFLLHGFGGKAMHLVNGLITVFVLIAYTFAFGKRQKDRGLGGYELRSLTYAGIDYWIGFTLIVAIFGTTLLAEPLSGIMRFFSDGDDVSAGLKFLFGYNTASAAYQGYLMGALAVLGATFFLTAYHGIFYYYIYKGAEGVRPNGQQTEHRKGFRNAAGSMVAVLLICFSIFPEGTLDLMLGAFSDLTVHEIMTGSK